MANDIIDCCPHCGHPYHQSRSTTDPLPLINDHSFISDLARFAEGIVSQQDVKKKYRLEESEWDALGENDELVRAVDAEKVRRIRNGSSAREKAQLKFIAAPDVLSNILTDNSASPRHRIEASRELKSGRFGRSRGHADRRPIPNHDQLGCRPSDPHRQAH